MSEDNRQEWWCSWCFAKVTIELCTKKSLRSIYKCQSCFNLVKKCTAVGCKGLARYHSTYSEKVCAVHANLLKHWGTNLTGDVGMCSWCFKPTEHQIVALKLVKRTTFKCQSCNNSTIRCQRCDAFARGYNHLCIKCQGVISSWESVVPKELDREGWCSWCFEKGFHIFQQKNFVGRNTYMCGHCFLRTLPCIKCNQGMTRGGIAWDDKLCARCSWETGRGWEQVKQRKDMLIEHRNLDIIKAEMSRDSKYRRKAMKHGLIRPFLLLVAMPPMLRNQVTSFLGWTIFTQKTFGDTHAECWQILNGKMVGIAPRCNTSWEKVNPLYHANWYEILIRVTKLAFSQDPSKSVAKDLSSSSQILEACRDSKNPLIPKLEEAVIVIIEQYILSQMSTEQREELTRALEGATGLALLSQLITSKTGITSKDALSYGYKIADQVLGLQSAIATALYTETTKWLALSTKPIIVALLPAVAASISFYSTFLATPLFVLGILGLVKTGINLVFGSSEGRLIVPMITILNQRILLALEGIRLEDYY